MEIHDSCLVFICIIIPVAQCGRITDYFMLQRHLEEYLQYKASRYDHGSGDVYSKIKMWKDLLFRLNHTKWDDSKTADFGNGGFKPQPNTLSVISSLSSLHSPFVHILDNWKSTKEKRQYLKHTDFNVEILLVVDNSIFRKYLKEANYRVDTARKKIYDYYSILFSMVSQRFEVIPDRTFSVKIHICDIYIAEARRDSGWIEYLSRWSNHLSNGVVNASKALRRFQKWLRKTKSLPLYDHAVVFTSYILNKRRKQVDGLVYISSMCKVIYGESSSIVQDQGDFQSAAVVAHELGHSLGATHDGDKENRDCPSSQNYIMAPQVSGDTEVASNVYHFSKCSIRQIKDFLSSTQSKCLYNKPKSTRWHYSLRKCPPGQMIDADEQCQLSFSKHSEFCVQGVSEWSVCRRLWCTSPTENDMVCRSNNRLMALPGTSCGKGMHCHLGECVASLRSASRLNSFLYPRIRFRNDTCPLGDGNPIYCSTIIKASPYLCDRPKVATYCCESCGSQTLECSLNNCPSKNVCRRY